MAVRIDAAADYLARTSGLPNLDPVTACAWVYLVADRDAQGEIFEWANATLTDYVAVHLDATGTVLHVATPNGYTAGSTLETGRWYHIAFVHDGSAMTLYVDGTSDISRSDARSFTLAYLLMGSETVHWINGRLAGIKVWNAALSQSEVQAERNQYRPVRTADLYGFWPLFAGETERLADYSGNGRNLTAGGTLTDEAGPTLDWARPTDAATLGESVSVDQASGSTPVSGADSATLADAAATVASAPASDGVTLADTAATMATTAATDGATLGESAGLVETASVSGTDAATLGETVAITVSAAATDAGAQGETAAAGATDYFGAKYEPPAGRILHGLGQWIDIHYTEGENWGYVDDYEDAVGAGAALYSVYAWLDPALYSTYNWRPFSYFVEQHPERQYIYLLGLMLTDSTQEGYVVTPSKILNGDWDAQIVELARQVKNAGGPVYIRPGLEFGSGNSGVHSSGMTAAQFIAIWRHIVDIFRAEGANNVAWVWNTVNPDVFSYLDWYPGDDYVDWWGINYFTVGQMSAGDGFLAAAATHRKPVMVCESCPIEAGTTVAATWADWFTPYFAKIRGTAHLKAFVYISNPWDKPGYFDSWADSRIDGAHTNATVRAGYLSELDDAPYVHRAEYLSNPELVRAADTVFLATPVSGSGTVERDPDQAEYASGTEVTLTAVADADPFFGWGGDLSGSANPSTFEIGADIVAWAVFSTAETGSDSGSLTDAGSVSAAGSATDAGALAESPVLAVARPATDAASLTESAGLAPDLPATDSGVMGESVVAAAGTPVSDAGVLTDVSALATGLSATDTVAVADASSLGASSPATDSGMVAEASSLGATLPISDAGSLAESALLSTVALTASDAGALAESADLETEDSASRNATDGGVLAEAVAVVVACEAADGLTLAESAMLHALYAAIEAGTVGESAATGADLAATDAGSLGDTSSLSEDGSQGLIGADTIALGESAAVAALLARLDAVTVLDLAVVPAARPVTPLGRTYVVAADDRLLAVGVDDRMYEVSA